MADYIERGLAGLLIEATETFPAVMLHGARQTGKTTLLKHCLGKSRRYVSMERAGLRELAERDPEGFLDLYPPPVILDEIQRAPGLLPSIKERIDEDRDRCGQYILTGSQNLLMMETVSESLAGRCAVLQLHSLAHREMAGDADRPLPWEPRCELRESDDNAFGRRVGFCERLLTGGYPDVVLGSGRHRDLWFESYVQTYVERDVRTLRQVGDMGQFQKFVTCVALRNGQLFNMSDVARDLGLTVNTIKAWLSVLEASGLVIVLKPYFTNTNKRLVKTPKVYITDTGLLCALAGITNAEQLALSPFSGAVMEAAVLMEIVKGASFRGHRVRLYFWRTSNGAEVDIVVEQGYFLTPVEVKLSATPRAGMSRGIERFRAEYGEQVTAGWVIHSGDLPMPLGNGNIALPFDAM